MQLILLRSPGTVLHYYIRALEEERIPWACDAADDLFASTEVNVALSILQVVDNPYQDIPLLAALRSPVYGFSADKLAALRALGEGDFYTVLTQAAEQGDAACKEFLEQLKQLRLGAGDKTCRQLIWHIYEQTNLLGLFGCMEDGLQRQNNLLAFYTLAGQLEESGCRSLFQFLLRLQRLRENGTRLNVNSGAIHSEGVSILSIHKSKGLEKPVVFVAGLMKRLNREDMIRPVLFHPEMGVGCKGLEQERMVEVSWASSQQMTEFNAGITIIAYDHVSLLGELAMAIGNMDVPIVAVSAKRDEKKKTCIITMVIQVKSREQLDRVITQLHKRSDIIEVYRGTNG